MRCLGLCAASQRGRTECVPPRKPPPTLFPAFPRKAVSHRLTPFEGRAPHARSDGIGLAGACPIWPPGVRFPPMIMLRLGMSKALPRGRGDRAPPRKSPSASAPGFPREAILAWIAPAEGRAPHARKESITPTPTLPLLATGPPTRGSRWPRPVCARPCFSDAETAPLRENRLPRCLRAFPARRCALRLASRGGAGSARPRGLRSELSQPSVKPNEILKRNALDFQSRFCFAPG
jgi:hypothetical protein